jgi:hypothetical protein
MAARLRIVLGGGYTELSSHSSYKTTFLRIKYINCFTDRFRILFTNTYEQTTNFSANPVIFPSKVLYILKPTDVWRR